ncbi:hypothetical protein [Vibrio alginolyticus]|uniref:hypothetical protein n=1 Tax=Vibrio TaxID=662 RepID=UPI0006CA70C7|nr:hypothetical protein [Vibrio alginolyticus]KPM97601.1 hypothetical protein AOG25_14125 [Vibrio alginolyticus]CAH7202713.1 conserved hypothetical protein [Vibrio chagasii]CAH7369652.1 conserved hypothetical protein [Vibrio chagasii]
MKPYIPDELIGSTFEEIILDANSRQCECDGMAHYLSYRFNNDTKTQLSVYEGLLVVNGKRTPHHVWTVFENDGTQYLIDLRARMWIPSDEDTPHGIYPLSEVASSYLGQPTHKTWGNFSGGLIELLFPSLEAFEKEIEKLREAEKLASK